MTRNAGWAKKEKHKTLVFWSTNKPANPQKSYSPSSPYLTNQQQQQIGNPLLSVVPLHPNLSIVIIISSVGWYCSWKIARFDISLLLLWWSHTHRAVCKRTSEASLYSTVTCSVSFFFLFFFLWWKRWYKKKKGKSRKDINNLSSKKKNFFLITLFYLFSMSFLKIKLLETVIPASSSCSYYCYYRCCWWYQPDCTYCRIIQH